MPSLYEYCGHITVIRGLIFYWDRKANQYVKRTGFIRVPAEENISEYIKTLPKTVIVSSVSLPSSQDIISVRINHRKLPVVATAAMIPTYTLNDVFNLCASKSRRRKGYKYERC